jgi:sterol 24-C-methyltransferase
MGNADNTKKVLRYYDRTESRIGYHYLLHDTKHFGWYEPGQSMWKFSDAMRRMEDELGNRLNLPHDAEVLDAGFGSGNVARYMATRYQLRVTGIDLIESNAQDAQERSAKAGLSKRTRFLQGDYHNLNFPDNSFDGIYTFESFVHAADPAKVLAEFLRVLRPGGRLVMFEYSRTPEADLSPEANEALRRVCELAAMPSWLKLNHGDLELLLKQTGFVAENVDDITERMLPMLHAFSIIGRFPYFVGRVSGRVPKVVNALSGVEMYKHQDAWRYKIWSASKPR